MQLVIVKAFLTPDEARMMQSLLRNEGIESFLKDENTAQVAPYLQGAISGVKLLVAETDATLAYNILLQAGYIKEEREPAKQRREWWKALILIVAVGGLLAVSRGC